jgi:EmrB/QacA subfamily drug resistance transporter
VPCDEAVIRSVGTGAPCRAEARTWILAATILGSSMAFIDSTVVTVALPAIQARFHGTVVDVQWVVESYGLFLAALILVGGSLGDVLGRRKIFLVGVLIFAIASLACGLAPSIQHLIVARSIQGVGAALLVPGSLAIISACFAETSRGQSIGTWSGFTTITTAIGPVLGGWLVEHASWRWAFLINVLLAAVVIAISVRYVPESRGAGVGRVDWLGALLVTIGLGGLVTGFIESVNWGWKRPVVLGSLIVGCACLSVFILVEGRVTAPMVPPKLFASRTFSGANLLTLFLYAAIGIFFFLFPLNLIQVQGYSATAAGAAVLPLILLMFTLSRWSGGLVTRYGPRLPLIIGPLIAALGFGLFAVSSTGGSYWKNFSPGVVVLGFGMAVTVAPLTTVVMNSADRDRVGAASGINNAAARVAGVLAIAVLGTVMVNAFGYELNRQLGKLFLAPDVLHDIQAQKSKLAGVELPASLDANMKAAIGEAVRQAFVFGFRLVMLICVALCMASAWTSWRLIPRSSLDGETVRPLIEGVREGGRSTFRGSN